MNSCNRSLLILACLLMITPSFVNAQDSSATVLTPGSDEATSGGLRQRWHRLREKHATAETSAAQESGDVTVDLEPELDNDTWVPSGTPTKSTQKADGPPPESLAKRRKHIERALRQRDSASVAWLIKEMEDQASLLAPMAAWALGQIGDRMSIPALYRALEDGRAVVRSQALEALIRMKADGIEKQVLQRLTTDQSPQVRAAAATGAGVLELQDAVEPLLETLRKEGPLPRLAAAWSLAHLGHDEGYAHLAHVAMLHDQTYAPRAIGALSMLKTDEGYRVMLRCLLDAPPPGQREARRLLLGVPRAQLEKVIGWFPRDAQVRMLRILNDAVTQKAP